MNGLPPPICRIIAGPNGAGKTTFALKFLPKAHCLNFVNADLIAAGLSPLAPEQQIMAASRLFLGEIEQHIQARRDFAFETTLSGRTYLRLIRRLRTEGWHIELYYLALPSLEMSRRRVAERVAHGGHSISLRDITRRFPRSLHNLFYHFSNAVDQTLCFLNTGDQPELVFEQYGAERLIIDEALYNQLLQEANL